MTSKAKKKKTRNQYASPPEGNAIPAGPLSDFFTNLGMGSCPRSVASRQISRLWLLKCGLPGVKIAKIAHFWYNFAKNGLYPLNQFLQNLALGGSPTFAPSRQILPFWLSKCGLTAQKIAKNGNF